MLSNNQEVIDQSPRRDIMVIETQQCMAERSMVVYDTYSPRRPPRNRPQRKRWTCMRCLLPWPRSRLNARSGPKAGSQLDAALSEKEQRCSTRSGNYESSSRAMRSPSLSVHPCPQQTPTECLLASLLESSLHSSVRSGFMHS